MTKIGESPLFLEQMQKWSISDSTKSYPFLYMLLAFFFFFSQKEDKLIFQKENNYPVQYH